MQALWMVLAAFLFASMGVCVKVASEYFNSAELVCYRGLIGMLILWLLARSQRVTLATQYPGIHAWRSLVGVVSLGAWFFAIAHLPLATAMALNYLSSVWIAAFLIGGTLLAWRPSAAAPRPTLQGPLVLTVLAGFAGVVLLLRPSLHQNQSFAGLIGLLSGITAAFAYMQVVALARMGEPEERTVFYFAMGAAVAGGAALLLTGTSPWPGWPVLWLLPIGILAAAGQLCMTRAYASAKTQRGTLLVANLQYSGIVFSAIYSVLWGDEIPPIGWIGMALIVGSGIVATILRERTAPGTPAEEH
ncbi:DMT family transporter [Verminephrobacter eiseniae]|uniref:DMT family transporter n=1 Tax=Verminephrobacter eiseniae TaxID=364317 RepID=UPI0022382B56|nr:DMT family transporter [Verminephrobacter eiseniae]MCW5231178.1 DMT family transporter [Verminephrobacter eiseniae]MCW5292910.1 DMT family transporter [Verminephrobacter eiseniae]MCW8185849.1 DMT family transporter [Verminephrobacter eiseniae]MCW8226216.1 DMT family transporter [Verminephrobacter eiseniae]MCW8232258.1 DMT family transporter [Verminephrobacter eiseniae]